MKHLERCLAQHKGSTNVNYLYHCDGEGRVPSGLWGPFNSVILWPWESVCTFIFVCISDCVSIIWVTQSFQNPGDFLTLGLLDLPFLTTSIGQAWAPTHMLWKVQSPSQQLWGLDRGVLPSHFLMKPSAVWRSAPKLHRPYICMPDFLEVSSVQQETIVQSRKQVQHQGETIAVWVNKPLYTHTVEHCAAVKKSCKSFCCWSLSKYKARCRMLWMAYFRKKGWDGGRENTFMYIDYL